MGMINPKNFAAPFKQRMQLMTIILISVAFTIIRISGDLSRTSVGHSKQRRHALPRADESGERLPRQAVKRTIFDLLEPTADSSAAFAGSQKSQRAASAAETGRSLETSGVKEDASSIESPAAAALPARRGAFAEIERRLGLAE